MTETVVLLNSVEKVKSFVVAVSKFEADMDLSKPIVLKIYEDGDKAAEILKELKEYIE